MEREEPGQERELAAEQEGAARPHPPAQAVALLAGSLALFLGAWALGRIGPGPLRDVGPALGVLAWILPAYVVRARAGGDPFRWHALLVRPRGLPVAVGLSLLLLGLYVLGVAVLAGGPPTRPIPWGAALERLGSDLLFVALPEEYFFRGVLQPSLDRVAGPARRLLGAPFGRGALLAAALFALAHLALDPDPRRLAVFFPGLWFAWLRARTGSLAPGIAAHALANAVEQACFAAW